MRSLIAFALAVAVPGCAWYSGRGLVPGQSSVAEVEALMGPASDRRTGPAGETVRYYSRLPAGRDIYAARFGPDGKLKALEQRLTPESVAKIIPGRMRADDVRELLGPPWRVDDFPRLEREIWTYPMRANDPVLRELYVQFSRDGVVREVLLMDDPITRGPSGRD